MAVTIANDFSKLFQKKSNQGIFFGGSLDIPIALFTNFDYLFLQPFQMSKLAGWNLNNNHTLLCFCPCCVSERGVRSAAYQHFCRSPWWCGVLFLVIWLWAASLQTLANIWPSWQNEREEKGILLCWFVFVNLKGVFTCIAF